MIFVDRSGSVEIRYVSFIFKRFNQWGRIRSDYHKIPSGIYSKLHLCQNQDVSNKTIKNYGLLDEFDLSTWSGVKQNVEYGWLGTNYNYEWDRWPHHITSVPES